LHGIYDSESKLISGSTNDNKLDISEAQWLSGHANTDSRVFFTPEKDGRYYIAAGHAGWQEHLGLYTLSVTPTGSCRDDSGPDFGAATATRALAENSPAGTPVGEPITAGDQDDVTLAYSLEGADAASFAIDTATGQLATVEGVVYDFETRASYAVTVRAGSSAGGSATIAVTVNLTGEQEPPNFDGTETTRTLAEHSLPGTPIGEPVVATDPDGDTLVYTLE
jgi:hypothetical protein